MREEIPASLAGERIDRVVAALTGLTRATVSELIEQGEVLINDQAVSSRSRKVTEGQILEVEVPDAPTGPPKADPSIVFEVFHADDDVIVINKPAGLVVHPGASHEDDTLVNGLLARYPDMVEELPGDPQRPGIVHRLDVGTSGLMIAVRTQRAYEAFVEMMKQREVDRRYLTLAWGDVQPDKGLIDAPIGRSDREPMKMAVSSGGKAARTHYEVVRRSESPKVSLVEVKLDTGRTHQIRVHFAAIGHPVVGDARYRGVRPGLSLPRPFLHAQYLDFVHPFTKEQLHFEAPVPDDLSMVVAELFA